MIIRDGNHYRLLHGQLRLVAELSVRGEAWVEVKEEGKVRVLNAREGLLVERGNQRLPLLRND